MSALKENLATIIISSARSDGWCYLPNRELANLVYELTGTKPNETARTVQRHLALLKDEGRLEQRFDEFTGERKLRVRQPPAQ